ncbi:hypothetical protein ASPWEDRAFT_72081 [Aspergillus wentii DTO 134E9]|uniref:F-box domain-containing protein n=1 Tax=Aspergillus wentii DTO 134E9 TaxID=1073089 RepID=A0A1L9R837_ASPWE|nr:uncharacterized protein ASPWEDRAFT_72081 [Aspergillus wentii DTO 134E9]OJJ31079.1 hypothetical protein ASPWEDRAFT_72081 [Aspergillus wentii DTO 134E9]
MEDNAELESFRRQWREEVARRRTQDRAHTSQADNSAFSSTRPQQAPPSHFEVANPKEEEDEEDEQEEHGPTPFDQSEIVHQVGQLSLDGDGAKTSKKEPKSALEHFERAVEKEEEGSLGDSLQHYRKAYRLDSDIDKTYRNKHFAAAWKKPAQSSNTSTKGHSAAQQSQDKPVNLPTAELIASFAHLPIPQAEPLIENTPPPPCPIANVPSDVIVEVLKHVALMDPASFARVSLVCKRLAYHFAHEQHIWKRLCQGSQFGFKAMHYSFACDVFGVPEYTLGPRYALFPFDGPAKIPKPLSLWSQVFQTFPRIRFTGIYISTVNYTRPGDASAYQNISWNSPIHIVTYYRYLRFYPDGSVISLLTTTPPKEVVPHINMENVMTSRNIKSPRRQFSGAGSTLAGAPDPVPAVAMASLKYAQRGRWHLTKPIDVPDSSNPGIKAAESSQHHPPVPDKAATPDARDVVIETEGVGPQYVYTLHLSLRSSASRPHKSDVAPPNPSKNTKLAWRSYWSYNKLTDDWAEFRLQNDRSFVFRRVRGWGMS